MVPTHAASHSGRGVAVSLIASVLFAVIFLMAGLLPGWGAQEIFGWRVVLTLATLAVILPFLPWARTESITLFSRVRRRPTLLLPGVLAAGIVGVQLWLFMWAPLNNMALSVSFGYFLLPLTMVLAGRVFFADKLNPLRKLAVAAAVVGVAHEAFSANGLAWPTLVVCLGYPVYFVLRRKIGFDNLPAFAAELLMMLPLGVYFILAGPHGIGSGAVEGAGSGGLWVAISIGVLGGLAMAFYLLASKWLPLSLFGLLSYVEPVLLVGVSILLGETLGWSSLLTYGPIMLALVLLGVDGRRSALPGTPGTPGTPGRPLSP
ncbi:EamA family transporter RarD [Arthrobacter psychrochitiniphilus]|uniref:EamA family transporter RarD n=1 Tax=Arthrobacter psychrochitiniphilus TaxID=291045 RepID=A0A2V3DW05_9MICC|nr:EamA family transporter RarD [Arthrobacter psychrochitiniphilus]NYG16293.1 chloramphenicol-sensitive protein RarD [Arthrobacter psychrochitiniphilus]PXA69536.1 EamA family transporter RarD [Arthrobacter psychrochitiniphilus]